MRLFSGVCVISANSCVGAVDDGAYLTNWSPGQEADRLAKPTVC